MTLFGYDMPWFGGAGGLFSFIILLLFLLLSQGKCVHRNPSAAHLRLVQVLFLNNYQLLCNYMSVFVSQRNDCAFSLLLSDLYGSSCTVNNFCVL